jgi:hypothetical protein
MKNKDSRVFWPMRKLIRKNMRPFFYPFSADIICKNPIGLIYWLPSPQPARACISLADMFPETLHNSLWTLTIFPPASIGAKSAMPLIYLNSAVLAMLHSPTP